MMVLHPMHLEAEVLIDGELHEHHRRKERKHHGCCGRRSRAFIAGDVLGMLVEKESDLPLNHRLYQ